jgi:major vault protein
MANEGRDRDMVLAPGEYAYVLDTTKGLVNTVVGPNKISMSNTDQPVVWDTKTKRFKRVDAESAIQLNSIAPEGFYIALYNPAEKPPQSGTISTSVPLQVGHRVNLPGPVDRALWPGQMAEVIRGHHLRSNQYVLAQVYNDVAASTNWPTAVVKPAISGTPEPQITAPKQFTPGQLLIIKGTEVAFFIPPTGVKVVDDNGNFVREAVTLERLEYCILLDENGNKRFVQGPDVVFPEPTETFVTKDNQRKFRAIELNETSGLYIKVIADYKEEGREYKAGDELFITGKEQAIYFQREEHSIIRYGDQTKHYAVAVPAGEGRYVLDRNTGEITLRRGPLMLLCDPRREVIVRRVLAQETAKLWYPNNTKVLEVNAKLAEQEQRDGATAYEAGRPITASATLRNVGVNALYMADEQALQSRTVAGETFSRGTAFQPPRTITLDTKYEGAVGINLWTGYAVLVISKTGNRHVVVGPQNILLEYDETLAPLELSTGRPKNDIKLLKTVYLRVSNNKISDQISVETKDLVPLNLEVSYRVNFFEGEQTKWFAVENYVKLLTDHLRSKIRNVAKRTGIEDFYGNTADIIRNAILGVSAEGKRPGLTFGENGMHVYDIELLAVQITQPNVAALLHEAQAATLRSTIGIAQKEFELDITKRAETVARFIANLKADTVEQVNAASERELTSGLAIAMVRLQHDAQTADALMKAKLAQSELQAELSEQNLAIQKAVDEARITSLQAEIQVELYKLTGETEQIVRRAGAVGDKLATALTTLSDKAMVERIATSLAPIAAVQGVSAAEMLGRFFEGTPLKGVLDQLGERAKLPLAATNQ